MSRTFRKRDDRFKYKKRSERKPWEDDSPDLQGGDEKIRREQDRRQKRRESTEFDPSDE